MSRNPDGSGIERRDPGAGGPLTASGPIEHLFRHEFGRAVAGLTRRVGAEHLELVEDAVQAALVSALTTWTAEGLPENPAAWLYRVAHNRVIGDLRQRAARARILEKNAGDPQEDDSAGPHFADEMRDDVLRMLFVCCDDAIPAESRLVLALKTLCGFSTAEIALRLFTTDANVFKRLGRARERLRESPPSMDTPGPDELRSRLPSVHAVLYLLFNEGYLSAHAEQAIRRELCEEAIRLATLLAENPVGAVPETFAIAECEGPAAGLAVLDGLVRPPWLEESYLWDAVFADVHRRAGNLDLARRHGEKALEGAPSAPVRELLRRRLGL